MPADDASARPLAAKLLTRPDLLASVRELCRDIAGSAAAVAELESRVEPAIVGARSVG